LHSFPGGARGQGAAEAKLFAGEGAKVVIGDVRDELTSLGKVKFAISMASSFKRPRMGARAIWLQVSWLQSQNGNSGL